MSGQQEKMVDYGKILFHKKKEKADLEEALKTLNKEIVEIETVSLAKLMTDAEVDKFTIADLGTIYLKDELYVSVLAEDRPKLYDALRDAGNEDLIVDWVFPNTLKAFCKEQLEGGKSLPEVIKTSFIPTARTKRS